MPKYINSDELIKRLRNDLERWGNYTAEQNPYKHAMRESVLYCICLVQALKEDIVCCKNCVYANENGTTCHYGVGHSTRPERFCSEGERRESEVEAE